MMTAREQIAYMLDYPRRARKHAKQAARRAAWILAHGVEPEPQIDWSMKFPGAARREIPHSRLPRLDSCWYDHVHTWNRGGRAVCVTLQPYLPAFRYKGGGLAAVRKLRALGLTVRVRGLRASWWNPGQTVLIECWAPGEAPLRTP